MYLKNNYKIDLFLALIFLIVIIGASIYPIYAWTNQASKELDILIIDKTVPNIDYREHRGLAWILNYHQYLKSSGEEYNYETDYLGFVPLSSKEYSIRDIKDMTSSYDLVYLADTYGVYEQDFGKENVEGLRSELIYGGLNKQELEHIKHAVWNGATLIAEFNTFASPTSEVVRNDLTHLLGIHWSGWMGRYFTDLSEGSEVPIWVVENYQNQQQREWDFTGSGFVFADDNDQVVVLESERDLVSDGCSVIFSKEGQDRFSIKNGVYYNYWFDVVEPREQTKVLAEYKLDLSEQGSGKLSKAGIPEVFPAILEYQTGVYHSYYFAGDYADVANVPNIYKVIGIDKLNAFISRNSLKSQDAFYWKVYVPVMEQILSTIASQKASKKQEVPTFVEEFAPLIARTGEQFLQVYRNGDWQNLPIKGVNIGMAKPGKWFTDFPDSEEPYLRWFQMIGDMDANTIRVYTLQHPAFYRALLQYNTENPDSPLYLMQEIWPEEHPPNDNLLETDYQRTFFNEIEYVVDAIHGNAAIEERQGRAWGLYHADVSEYTISYLVGREVEPEEVLSTDKLNIGYTFLGEYLQALEGTPTESWFAKNCDYVLAYEEKTYSRQTPVAIVSWPTLDPIEHDYALNDDGTVYRDFNDKAAVNINHIKPTEKLKAGFYGAYHIYPNYPDFMNYKETYAKYFDEQGEFRYGGYLQEFMEQHQNHLALIAEFGLATGMGNAHSNPDGYHHGGMTEVEQGLGVVRMMETIYREGYMGGLVFEWMDEWAKKTWTTEPFMIPYENHVFWHNAIDPEQNYGILAVESVRPMKPGYEFSNATSNVEYKSAENTLQSIELRHNETYAYIDIHTKNKLDLEKYDVIVGIDTYDRNRGEYVIDFLANSKRGTEAEWQATLEKSVILPTGIEFKAILSTTDHAEILVIPSYNSSNRKYSSTTSIDARFEKMRPLINKRLLGIDGEIIEEIYEDASTLRYGALTGSTNHWLQDGSTIFLQLPWGRLNFTDPSNRMVLDDVRTVVGDPVRDELQIVQSEGILVYLLVIDRETNEIVGQAFQDTSKPYTWDSWGEPTYIERLKDSYGIIQKYFQTIK